MHFFSIIMTLLAMQRTPVHRWTIVGAWQHSRNTIEASFQSQMRAVPTFATPVTGRWVVLLRILTNSISFCAFERKKASNYSNKTKRIDDSPWHSTPKLPTDSTNRKQECYSLLPRPAAAIAASCNRRSTTFLNFLRTPAKAVVLDSTRHSGSSPACAARAVGRYCNAWRRNNNKIIN
jgi:hypothetical protein